MRCFPDIHPLYSHGGKWFKILNEKQKHIHEKPNHSPLYQFEITLPHSVFNNYIKFKKLFFEIIKNFKFLSQNTTIKLNITQNNELPK